MAEQTRFLRELLREKLDLVHFLNFNHPLLYRRPFVTTLHDLTVYLHPVGRSQKSRLRRAGFLLTLRRSLTAARRVIAVSENTATDAAKYLHIPHAKMEVIYEGAPAAVDIPFGSKAMVQEYLGSRQPYFLFVSQWRPHKGLVTLLDAFARFKQETGLPHQLVLLGNQKDCPAEVRERLALSPVAADILTPGFAPDELLPSIYRNASTFISPSEYEGFGLPILEAFTHGAPVIAADNSSQPELVGPAGLLFITRDVQDLAQKMVQIVQDQGLADQLKAKAPGQLAKFSWDRMAERTQALYLEVLEKGR